MISIILPVYNEEEVIGWEIKIIQEAMNEPYEIIVVDDGSTDGTAEIVKRLDVKLIQLKENEGVGFARKIGTLQAKGDIIVWTDVDGTYPNHEIPKLILKIKDYDQVVGARRTETGDFKSLRFIVKWLIRKLAEILSGKKIPDLNSGLRVFKRDIAFKYLLLLPKRFSCVSTMTLAFLCNGHSVGYVPIDYYKRIGKSKFHPIEDTYLYILQVLRMITLFK